MDFSKKGTLKKQEELRSSSKRMSTKLNIMLFRMGIVLAIAFIVTTVFLLTGFVKGLIDVAPSISSLNVMPSKYKTYIYDSNGKEIQVLVGEEANREFVSIDKIPENVQNAFIDIEDERFYEHNGIDVKGVFRAAFVGFSNGFSEGASTLTQQLIKNCMFGGGMETSLSAKIERKIQEQYLAVQLENKMDKERILEYYLNTINLGAGTYGVETACKRYFNKSVSDINLSEATVIASITKNPIGLNPINYPDDNKIRRKKVLDNMLSNGHITKKEYDEAIADDVYGFIKSIDLQYKPETTINSYFVDALYLQVKEDLINKLNYDESKATELINSGGLKIYSTQDTDIQKICDDVLNDTDNFPSAKYQLTYNITVQSPDGNTVNKSEGHLKNYFTDVKGISDFKTLFSSKEAAAPYIDEYKAYLLSDGSKFVAENTSFSLQPQTSFLIMDQYTGQVKALVGGRGKKATSLSLNRATGSKRQPGSTFKVLSTFLPAIDTAGMTLATVHDDSEYYYPDNPSKQVKSWEGDNYHGLVSMRFSIAQSNNITSVKTLSDISVQTGLSYLDSDHLNFTTLITDPSEAYNDTHTSLALGGLTQGVTNEELTAGYAAIASGGTYHEASYYTKITDRSGKVLLERNTSGKQVMKETTAWLLTDAMKDVVESGTGKIIGNNFSGMAVAGKTGTTSNSVDLWFTGYTPYYTASIWMGYDQNNAKLTSSTTHKYNWAKIMRKIHANLSYKDFSKPNGIVTATICTKCGNLAVKNLCSNAIGGSCVAKEYFAAGTAPTKPCTCHEKITVCNISGHKASAGCTSSSTKVYLIKDETSYTDDSDKILSSSLQSPCSSCFGGNPKSIAEETNKKDNTTTRKSPAAKKNNTSATDIPSTTHNSTATTNNTTTEPNTSVAAN